MTGAILTSRTDWAVSFWGTRGLPVVAHPPTRLEYQTATHGDTSHICITGTSQLDVSFPPNPPKPQSPTFLLQNTRPHPATHKSQRKTDRVKPAPSSETCKISALHSLQSPTGYCLSVCLSMVFTLIALLVDFLLQSMLDLSGGT